MILLVMFVITLIIVLIMSSFSVVDIVFPCGPIVIHMIVDILLDLYCILNKLPDPKCASYVCLWV